jgi:hypothetical protein
MKSNPALSAYVAILMASAEKVGARVQSLLSFHSQSEKGPFYNYAFEVPLVKNRVLKASLEDGC